MIKTLKIYAWIKATANSKIESKIWAIKIKGREKKAAPIKVDLNKEIKRWPAIILVDSRIANVPGRIRFLIVSIKTIKGINRRGVFWGIKWIRILVMLNE